MKPNKIPSAVLFFRSLTSKVVEEIRTMNIFLFKTNKQKKSTKRQNLEAILPGSTA